MSNLTIGGMISQTLVTQGLSSEPRVLMSTYEGSVRGGDVYTVVGSHLNNSSYKDTFTSISSSFWNIIDSGSGASSASSGLSLTLGSAGGTAGIRSAVPYKNFDISLAYSHNDAIEKLNPTATIVFCRLQAYISAGVRAGIEHKWTPSTGPILYAYVYSDSTLRQSASISVSKAQRTMRLVRYGGTVQMWVGSTMVLEYDGWHDTTCNIDIASESGVIPVSTTTTVSSYTPNVMVTFGGVMSSVISDSATGRLVGYTPAFKHPGYVDIVIHSVYDSYKLDNQFNYTSVDQLTVSQVPGVIYVNDDDTLRDTSSNLSGLRL